VRRAPETREVPVDAGMTNFQFWSVLVFGLAFCLAVAVELGGTTPEGTLQLTHWTPWRDLGIFRTSAILFPPFLLIAWVVWRTEKKDHPVPLLAALVAASLGLQALSMLADPRGFDLIRRIVISPGATSYFTDAVQIGGLRDWLQHFHQLRLGFHSSTHPAGPVLFYYAYVKLFGASAAPMLGGWTVGLLASAGVPVLYRFSALWTEDARTRLTACTLYVLLPAVTLFFPEFDQVYPLLTMGLAIFWVKALHEPGFGSWIVAGAILFLTTFLAYNLLLFGAFPVYYGLYWIWRAENRREARQVLARGTAIVLGTVVALYAVLWAASGYNPIASLQRSLAIQDLFALTMHRPYATFIFFDVYDLFLGAGMLAFLLLLFHWRRQLNSWDPRRPDIAMTLISMATILTVDLSGLLRGETARVWLFLQPLLAVPVALELVRAPWQRRLGIFALQWWILACLKAKMTFLDA
jgi:hypothetical protein